MLSIETRAAIPLDRAAPLTRGLWSWPALVVAVALVLDAVRPIMPVAGRHGVMWLELAALACLGWATLGPQRAARSEWASPVDGRILSGLVLSVLHVVKLGGAEAPVLWLRQCAASGVCFYALGARLRRDPRAPDAVWPAFALLTLALATYTLGFATRGVAALRELSTLMDARWASQCGLARTLLLVTILCMGRACEPGARALWRVTTLLGAVVGGLMIAASGAGLGVSSLASLDDPFYFGTSIVAFMLLVGMSRMAWKLVRERPDEAGRWRATAVFFPAVAVLLLFGGATGGEGVRTLAGLAAAAVVAARVAPRTAVARREAPRAADEAVARAA